MIIIYTPADGEPEEYDTRTLKVSEASIVSRTIDMKWGEIKEALPDEDIDAMRGVVWVLKKRSQPSLRFGEFDPGIAEMVTRLDRKEVLSYIEEAFAVADTDPDVTREDIARALRDLPAAAADPAHAEAAIAEMAKDPKDPAAEAAPEAAKKPGGARSPSRTSTSPEPSTSDSSPTS